MVFVSKPARFEASDEFDRTLLRNFEYGRPRSRAKDHIIREEVATNPMVAQTPSVATIDAIAVVPLTEPVA